jgi:ElaB/YqjD/DUF883 family membrane-anchored ribosome-binding protein
MDICTTSEDRTWKEKLSAKTRDIKSRSVAKVSNAGVAVRRNPVKWAGIAVATALGAGLAGRFLRNRSLNRRVPAILIVDAMC